MEFVCLGKIVNTHGIKGEVRILSQIRYKDRIFVKGMPIYIGRKKVPEVIDGYRVHKNFDMTPDGIIKKLELRKPIYRATTNYGHLGKESLSWEKVIPLEKNI